MKIALSGKTLSRICMGKNEQIQLLPYFFYCEQVCAFNRTVEKVDRFLANEAKGSDILPLFINY